MKISFTDSDLEKQANNDKLCVKVHGKIRAKILKKRLDHLASAISLEDCRHLPGHYHELKNDLKGYWACDLDQPYRLIFRPIEDPIPINEDGQYLWSELSGVEIVRIADYHKER